MKKKVQPDFKTFKEMGKASRARKRDHDNMVKEHIEEKREQIYRVDYKKLEPVYQDRVTFTSIQKKNSKKSKKPRSYRDPHFGKQQRFQKTQKEKFDRQIRLYNDSNQEGRTIDPKNDPSPGPGYYKLQETWKGKILPTKGKRRVRRPYSAQPKIGQRILQKMSKGPSFSIYNPRR